MIGLVSLPVVVLVAGVEVESLDVLGTSDDKLDNERAPESRLLDDDEGVVSLR
jgi:hypothetical protein